MGDTSIDRDFWDEPTDPPSEGTGGGLPPAAAHDALVAEGTVVTPSWTKVVLVLLFYLSLVGMATSFVILLSPQQFLNPPAFVGFVFTLGGLVATRPLLSRLLPRRFSPVLSVLSIALGAGVAQVALAAGPAATRFMLGASSALGLWVAVLFGRILVSDLRILLAHGQQE